MADEDLREVIGTLRRKRADHLASVERLDSAIHALLALDAESNGSPKGTSGTTPPTSRMSVRKKVLKLANEADQQWNAAEIVSEYERRQDPIQGAKPLAAVRTAIAEAYRAGDLVRVGHGLYKASQWIDLESGQVRELQPVPAEDPDRSALAGSQRG